MKEKIRQILSQRERKSIFEDSLTPAAVLISLYQNEQGYHILFTKRTQRVEYHKGQISFPGGAYESGDKALETTALRETFEEIGVKAEDVEILGQLDDFQTFSSNFVISPFVATIPYPYEFRISKDEIEELIEVPVLALLDTNNFTEDCRVYKDRIAPIYFYEYGGHIIWGATSRILKQFLDLIRGEVLSP